MAIEGVLSKMVVTPAHQTRPVSDSFKDILQKKRDLNAVETQETNLSLKSTFKDIVNNHEQAAKAIKSFMSNTDYSPEKLLKVQYKTGVFFLREQMFCKTAELSANTLKNFTQMQI